MAEYQYLDDGNADGTILGQASTSKLGFLGNTPITQQTGGTAADEIAAAATGCAIISSIHSIALSAASLANVNAAILASFGFSD